MTGSSLWYLNIKNVLAVNTCLCDNHEFCCVIILCQDDARRKGCTLIDDMGLSSI